MARDGRCRMHSKRPLIRVATADMFSMKEPTTLHKPMQQDDTLMASLAPLARGTACLGCRRRRVKCDGVRPHCSPCIRSHGHALRAAGRAGVQPPTLVCEWGEGDSASPEEPSAARHTPAAPKKKVSGSRKLPVEKEMAYRKEDEKEKLLARIAELEARLNVLTPPSSEASGSGSAYVNPSPSQVPNTGPSTDPDWDFSGLFMVPTNWPKNLPAPYLLEHLIETFFNSVPQLPRMLNRPKLMARIRLPPNHPYFPHPALLHSICATASQATAWVTSVPIEALEAGVKARHAKGESLEDFEDFALAQAESAHLSIHRTYQICSVGSPDSLLEVARAEVLISDVYLSRGMYLKGWSNFGQAVRYAKGLELINRNFPRRYKSGILPAPADDVDREERLATTWLIFISESFSGVSRYWPLSLDHTDMFCHLPAGAVARKDGYIAPNPQHARSPSLYTDHPVHDVFVLVCKVALLCSRTSRFVRDWAQREVRSGDALLGMRLPLFRDLVSDIQLFHIPDAFKNIFRIQAADLTAELLALHIMPNVCLLMLYESFADWDQPQIGAVQPMLLSYEAIMSLLYLIPSNLDVSTIITSDIASNLHTTGRIIADFIQHALDKQSYDLVTRYRADLGVIQSLLVRYGVKHPLGRFASQFLDTYAEARMNGKEPTSYCAGQTTPGDVPLEPTQFEGNFYDEISSMAAGSSSMLMASGSVSMGTGSSVGAGSGAESWSLFD